MSMSRNHLCAAESSDVHELVASMINDHLYWQSLRNVDDNGTKCSLIYKVVQCIRASDPNAYEPTVLSIGPYHHGAPSLLPMEKEKWLCLDYILKLNCNRNLHDYLAMVTKLERETRICYSEDNIMNSREFVEMLLLDSCFILVCLNGIGVEVQMDISEMSAKEQDVPKHVGFEQNEGGMRHVKDKEIMMEEIPSLSCRTKHSLVHQMERDQVGLHQHNKQANIMDSYNGQNQENVGQIEQWYNSSAVYDLLLLENQIPFFVVANIHELLVGERTAQSLLSENISKFIEGVLLHFPLAIQDTNRPKEFDHLLHLCYMYFKPSQNPQHKHQMNKRTSYFQCLSYWGLKYFRCNVDSKENEENPVSDANAADMNSVKELQRWRRAEQYHDAGVEFRDREFDEHNPHSLLDIEFRDGVLHIPCLPIDDKSATLLRNLVAFEQSCPALGNDIASYVHFFSQLMSISDDVVLLSRKGVIVHQLDSDEEVSILFSRLLEYAVYDFSGEHYLKPLCQTMEAHYQNRINRWISWLRHNHFGNPWLGFAALASVVMIFCSIGQTILAFLSYMSMP